MPAEPLTTTKVLEIVARCLDSFAVAAEDEMAPQDQVEVRVTNVKGEFWLIHVASRETLPTNSTVSGPDGWETADRAMFEIAALNKLSREEREQSISDAVRRQVIEMGWR